MNSANQLQSCTVSELLTIFVGVLGELRIRELVRSKNNPVADLSEYLVIRALRLKGLAQSNKGYDAVDGNGLRYEIKGRRLTDDNKSRMLSAIRDIEAHHFDFLAAVLFDENFHVFKACLVPFETVRTFAKHRGHVNAAIFEVKDAVWQAPGVVDITTEIAFAFQEIQAPRVKAAVATE